MRNQKGKIELQKKVHRRICVRDITFLTARSLYLFLLLSWLLPPTFQVKCLRNGPYKDIHIAMGGILCDDIVRKRSKIGKSPTIYI